MRAVLLALVFSALLTGCTPGHHGDSPAPAAPAPSAPAGDPGGQPVVATQPRTVTVDGLVHQLGRQGPTDPGGAYVIGARYDVRAQNGRVNTVVVTRRIDQRVVLVQPGPAGTVAYHTSFAGIWGDVLVLGYETADHLDPSRALIIDLATGSSTSLDRVPGAPPMSWSTAVGAVVDGRYYFLANNANAELDCVGEVDLTTMAGRTVECGKFGEWVKDLHPADHGASWLLFHGSSYGVCREGRTVHNGPSGSNAGAGAVGPASDCGTFDTTTAAGWQVWGSAPLGTATPGPEALAATDGRTTVQLGTADPRSLVGCAGYAYWFPDAAHHDVLRWRPGGDIERVYHDATPRITSLACADGILALTQDYGPPAHPVIGVAVLG